MGRCASYHVLAVPGELDTAYAGVEDSKASAEWPATRVVDSDIGPTLGCRELIRIIEVDPEPRRTVLDRIPADGRSHGIHLLYGGPCAEHRSKYSATYFASGLSLMQLCVTTLSKLLLPAEPAFAFSTNISLDEQSLIVPESA